MKNVTIEDIAIMAGVSIKTVSRVFNHEPNVRDTTRDKVLAAADKVNYRPNMAARRLASNKSYVIVHFHHNPNLDYLERAHQGIHKICRANGYFAVMEPLDALEKHQHDYTRQVRDYIREFDIDGIILTPPLSDDKSLISLLDKSQTPYVRLSPHHKPTHSSSTFVDEQAAARLMTEHLVELGHKEIAFILGPPQHGAAAARQKGFRAIVTKANLDAQACPTLQGDFSFRSGFEAFELLLQNPNLPSAIFAANDDMAAGAMMAALKAGLDIPSDMSIVGYDGSRVGEILWPALTTIRQPIAKMAERATELLLEHIRDPERETTREKHDVSLVKRDSCTTR